ncbi:hypothetical protein, partial [Streptococcus suis]|uniref:hypothetical protein n=1 Tax=Streptococcus suis TaxID=1307 RepID=UPI001EDDC2B0
ENGNKSRDFPLILFLPIPFHISLHYITKKLQKKFLCFLKLKKIFKFFYKNACKRIQSGV